MAVRKLQVAVSINRIPTIEELANLPLSRAGEYELSDKETQTLRSRLYAINKDGIRRYRTMRQAPYTMVWRIL
jgi:hypothetical protein